MQKEHLSCPTSSGPTNWCGWSGPLEGVVDWAQPACVVDLTQPVGMGCGRVAAADGEVGLVPPVDVKDPTLPLGVRENKNNF